MLIINGMQMYTTKEGYTVAIQKVTSSNAGETCEGELIETVIGHRPIITLSTNQMTENETAELLKIFTENDIFTVNYPIPYGDSNRGEQSFRLSTDFATTYKNLRHKKVSSTSITLTAVEASIVEQE